MGGDGVDRDGSESSEKDVGESGEKVTDEKGGVKDIESGEKVTDENVGEKDIGENDKENTNEKNTNPTDNNDKDKYTDNNNNSDNNPTTSMEPKEEDIQTKSSPPHDETPAIPIDFTEDFTTLFHSRSSQSLQTKPAEINPAEKNSTETKTEIGDEKKAVSMSARILGVLGRKTEEDKKKKQKKPTEDLQRIVSLVMERNLDPVIVFSFSKRDCETYALLMAKMDFTNADEKKLISEVIANRVDDE